MRPDTDPRQCTATAKRHRSRCQRAASHGHHVCSLHGGKTPRGILAPAFRHGKYSKYLPTGLRASYERAMRDPHLLELRHELALCDTRLSTLLQALDIDGTVAAWGTLQQALTAFQQARDAGDREAMQAHFDALARGITAGTADPEVWQEMYGLLELRRRLSETEHKRLVTGQHMLTAERANVLIAAIMATIKEQIALHTDPETGRRLATGLSAAFAKLALLDPATPPGDVDDLIDWQ